MKAQAQSAFRTLAIISVTLVTACNGGQEQPGDSVAPARDASVIEVTLERTACLGGCAIYRLEMDASGLVRYEGIAFVDRTGVDSTRISPEQVRQVVDSAEALGYFALADSYRQGDVTCSEYFPDSPSVIIGITADSLHKRVAVDHGCMDFPPELRRLAELIDEVAGSTRWRGH